LKRFRSSCTICLCFVSSSGESPVPMHILSIKCANSFE
jgi:hypothetical protein